MTVKIKTIIHVRNGYFHGAAFILWKRGSYFFRTWAKTALLLIAGCIFFLLLGLLFLPGYADDILKIFGSEIMFGLPNTSLKLIWSLCLISTLIAVIADILKIEFEKYAEKAVLAEKNRLSQESYENLRCQSEETRMLIHDTSKHYALLRAMLEQTPERMASYLDELIGQVKQIRPVVTCQNKILNILVNGKLNMAAQKGISVTIVRSDAPEKLPPPLFRKLPGSVWTFTATTAILFFPVKIVKMPPQKLPGADFHQSALPNISGR